MRRSLLVQIIETALITFIAWWTLAVERGEKPKAIILLWMVKRLRAVTAFFARCVIAAEISYYRAVTA